MWISRKKLKELESRLSALECKQRVVIQVRGKIVTDPKHSSSIEDHCNHDTHEHQ